MQEIIMNNLKKIKIKIKKAENLKFKNFELKSIKT